MRVVDEGGMAGQSGAGRAVVDGLGGRVVGREAGEAGVRGSEAPGGCAEWWPQESPATLLVLILSSQ